MASRQQSGIRAVFSGGEAAWTGVQAVRVGGPVRKLVGETGRELVEVAVGIGGRARGGLLELPEHDALVSLHEVFVVELLQARDESADELADAALDPLVLVVARQMPYSRTAAERSAVSVDAEARVMVTMASTISSLVRWPKAGTQQPSSELGQCSDCPGDRRLAFRQSSSAATSCALGEADRSAASMTRMAVSVETLSWSFDASPPDHRSTSSATARSAYSSLVNASSPEAIAAGSAWPELLGENN